ncbi:release factor glutamine methyltransferase [Sulfobacillus thermosulfidooxidans DSM 9293]|uniref:Release factor glutamine methyltransferase n=1 Tax=Sulfobacillus thermosulfidooxidans (strain DSM 9293 / VKM B-1269 / AT-1) TaxID=929705 RepID=A0A1W1WFY5_SULTA|nr:peptide chain release factor N(5)-glutamine methyltransferase [Sulfobacillus thermosulfidooxidans]SMC05176.1 release factor glutamine methyltransferase [Sulfobacillus thermosulfidooxidans DSM 9293]
MKDDWKVLVREAARELQKAGIDEPYAEAEQLWYQVSGTTMTEWLLGRGQITQSLLQKYHAAVSRRVKRVPFHYITGTREFMGLTFHVDPRVLIPRPETEHLVERVLRDASHESLTIVDVGTGSGAIAVSLAHFGSPLWQIIATDVSQEALHVAKENAKKILSHGEIRFVHSDLLSALKGPIDIVVANLPYVADTQAQHLMPELSYEPDLALYASDQGLSIIRRLIEQLPAKLASSGCVYLEIGQGQADAVEKMFQAQGLRVLPRTQDLAGIDRVVAAKKWEPGFEA